MFAVKIRSGEVKKSLIFKRSEEITIELVLNKGKDHNLITFTRLFLCIF